MTESCQGIMHILTSHDVIAVLPPFRLRNASATALYKVGNLASGNALDAIV